MTGTLYLVSTPIGNINDISIRAIDVLNSVDIILTEDTRVTSNLLKHHSVKAKSSLQSFNQINEDKKAPNIILALEEGKHIALVSDAGTPLISDPGYKFIKHARESNIKVEPVPGCCALIAAIISSGLPSDRFSFYGFLPRSNTKRISELKKISDKEETLIFYESVHRIQSTIEDMISVFGGNRPAVLCKEITKIHESFIGETLSDISIFFKKNEDKIKGEFTVVVQGSSEIEGIGEELDRVLRILMGELSLKKAVEIASKITKHSKSKIYDRALKIKNQ
ncbi:MAG: 16S rRNA (cytidine(1402)-2'-O)-methyltransferase [Pseudomonadota bacterium]|nr:16S rRNA (cytidine(1402)-2'-O)-methyltransferase [Pseudomonadota bacterium]